MGLGCGYVFGLGLRQGKVGVRPKDERAAHCRRRKVLLALRLAKQV